MGYLLSFGAQVPFFAGRTGLVMIVVIIVWSLVWKGLALWRAGREGSPAWFIVILILNTFGILEIVYLLFFSKKAKEMRKTAREKR